MASLSCRPLVRRAITVQVNRQSGPHMTRPSAPREIAASGPLDGRHLEPTAGSCSSRSNSLPEVLKRVRSFPPCRSRRCPHGPRSGSTRFADFESSPERGNLLNARRVRSPAKGGECPSLWGNPGSQGPRGNHLQSDCRRDGRVSSIALLQGKPAFKSVASRDVEIGHRVVRDRSAWLVGCLHTGRASWATTKGVECRCVQLVCPCGSVL